MGRRSEDLRSGRVQVCFLADGQTWCLGSHQTRWKTPCSRKPQILSRLPRRRQMRSSRSSRPISSRRLRAELDKSPKRHRVILLLGLNQDVRPAHRLEGSEFFRDTARLNAPQAVPSERAGFLEPRDPPGRASPERRCDIDLLGNGAAATSWPCFGAEFRSFFCFGTLTVSSPLLGQSRLP